MNDCLIPPNDDEGTPPMTASTKRRARRQAAHAAPALSCEVCHIAGDEKTLENRGKYVPYWMCPEAETSECNKRAGIIRSETTAEDKAQDAEGADGEPAEVTQA